MLNEENDDDLVKMNEKSEEILNEKMMFLGSAFGIITSGLSFELTFQF